MIYTLGQLTACVKDLFRNTPSKPYDKITTFDPEFTGIEAVPGMFLHAFYAPDDPAIPGFSPASQSGREFLAATSDGWLCAVIRSREIISAGSGLSNYWVSGYTNGLTDNELSFRFESKADCAEIKCMYIAFTDADLAEDPELDVSDLVANGWTLVSGDGTIDASGILRPNADNQRLVMKLDGYSPDEFSVGIRRVTPGNSGQGVVIFAADYCSPVLTKGCGPDMVHYDESGVYTGPVVEAEACKGPIGPALPGFLSPPIDNPPLTHLFQGEDSGTTDTGSYNLSLGNGNEWTNPATVGGWGSVMPRNGRITDVTFGARTNPADGSQYQLSIRSPGSTVGVPVGPVFTIPGGDLQLVASVDIPFNRGDSINIRTVEGGATDIVGEVWGYLA